MTLQTQKICSLYLLNENQLFFNQLNDSFALFFIQIQFQTKLIQSYNNNTHQMCSCLTEGLCCCFTCCCKDCLASLSKCLGKQKLAKVMYLVLVIIFTIPAIAILFFINTWSDFHTYFSWMACPSSSGGQFQCIGPSTIYRISLSFLSLFGLMLIFMLCRSSVSMVINEGFFCLKYLLVLGLFIVFLFIYNQTFNKYALASKYISIVFMIFQAIILIDLFYLAGIKLVARYDRGQTCCGIVLIFLTIFFQTIAVALNVFGYIQFSSADQCGSTKWVNVVTSIILAILPILQLFHFNKQNSLLTTSLVSLYISYLAYICQYSYGDSSCPARMTVKSIAADIIISTFIFILTTYGTIMGGSGQVKVTQNGDINKAMGVAPTGDSSQALENQKYHEKDDPIVQKNKQKQKHKQQDQESDAVNEAKYTESWGWAKWHWYMCLASVYVGMLATNWTSASLTTGDLISNGFGYWVRIAISWVTAVVYIWTLLAPKIFPERDFSVE